MKPLILLTILMPLLGACATKATGPGSSAKNGGRMPRVAQVIVPGGILLVRFDENDDYQITSQEMARGLEASFDLADEDKSGTLSLFEYRDWASKALGSPTALPDWMSVDRNQDRTISETEFSEAYMRIGNRLGLTQDSPLELAALVRDFEAVQQRAATRQSSGGQPGGGKRGGGGRKRLAG